MSRPDPFADVSRETLDKLYGLAALLERWNPRINLVSKSTLPQLWTRHLADSAQLMDLVEHPVDHWADLGSGGGFPGLVVGILASERNSPRRLTLVESDGRKCAFLRTVIRETGITAEVRPARIEDIPALNADVLSARALAPLTELLPFAEQHLATTGIALFQKGAAWRKEVDDAQRKWNFTYHVDKSITEIGPVILTIKGVSRA